MGLSLSVAPPSVSITILIPHSSPVLLNFFFHFILLPLYRSKASLRLLLQPVPLALLDTSPVPYVKPPSDDDLD